MSAWQSWYQRAREQRALARWHAAGHLDPIGLDEAGRFVEPAPTASDWLRFWRDASAWLAVLLLCSAAVCFIAANWSRITPGMRMGGVQVLLVVAALFAWPARATPWARTLAIFVACVLVGVLLALIGQTYQTGADPWNLFALWAVLMLPWALASGAVPVWGLLLVIGNLGLLLWAAITLNTWQVMLLFVGVNGLALGLWEMARTWFAAWDRNRAGARAVAALVIFGAAGFGMYERLSVADGANLPCAGIWVLTSAGLLAAYRWRRLDVVVLALWTLTALGMFTLYVGWLLASVLRIDMWLGWLVVALLVLGAAALAVTWLRRLAGQEARA